MFQGAKWSIEKTLESMRAHFDKIATQKTYYPSFEINTLTLNSR